MDKNVQNTNLADIMPVNLLEHETVRSAAGAIEPQLKALVHAIRLGAVIARIDELPEPIIDALAWQWRVDFYDADMGIAEKRRAVKQSIAMHRIKGTRRAIEMALRMVYASGEVNEWFEYGGKPYYFRVRFVQPEKIRIEDVERVMRIIRVVKNERSWLEGIGFIRPVRIRLYHGAAISTGKTYRLTYPSAKDTVLHSGTYRGIGLSVHKEVILHE